MVGPHDAGRPRTLGEAVLGRPRDAFRRVGLVFVVVVVALAAWLFAGPLATGDDAGFDGCEDSGSDGRAECAWNAVCPRQFKQGCVFEVRLQANTMGDGAARVEATGPAGAACGPMTPPCVGESRLRLGRGHDLGGRCVADSLSGGPVQVICLGSLVLA